MRRFFVEQLSDVMEVDDSIIVLLGDLGYGIFDKLRDRFPNRCINVGAAEQLMVGSAVGISLKNKIPICYSITPFLLYRLRSYLQLFLPVHQILLNLHQPIYLKLSLLRHYFFSWLESGLPFRQFLLVFL